MDVGRVLVLREALAASGWIERTQGFARTIRRSTKDPGGLLLVGTPEAEPWHMAAHLDDEARICGVEQMSPTLVRYHVPANAPPHLAVTLQRLEQAKRGETVFVVSEDDAPESLLERTWDARRSGATVLSLDGGDSELRQIAHESLTVVTRPPLARSSDLQHGASLHEPASDEPLESDLVSFDTVQHLVSVAVGETANNRAMQSPRKRFAALLETITGPRFDSEM